jgi:hypothetical protein
MSIEEEVIEKKSLKKVVHNKLEDLKGGFDLE